MIRVHEAREDYWGGLVSRDKNRIFQDLMKGLTGMIDTVVRISCTGSGCEQYRQDF